ncbi:MAG TPA: transporter substrate-binding domain-containing protein [Rectinemataceae bacterium]|nr:transporter substrate-binding domain-containing protein [Rectinemataceae bacterium]
MKRTLLLSLVIAMASSFVVSAQSLNVMAEENPPFNTAVGGEPSGAATDLFLAMARQAGIPLERKDIRTMPWAREYDMAQTGPLAVLFPVARTPAREKLFKWIGPFYKVQIGLIAPKARHFKFASAIEAARYSIGTLRDGAPEQALLVAGVPLASLDRGSSLSGSLKQLHAGRIDMFAFNTAGARYNLRLLGIDPDDYETVLVLSSPEFYFTLSKDSPDTTVAALQTALDALKKSGEYAAIIDKFIR